MWAIRTPLKCVSLWMGIRATMAKLSGTWIWTRTLKWKDGTRKWFMHQEREQTCLWIRLSHSWMERQWEAQRNSFWFLSLNWHCSERWFLTYFGVKDFFENLMEVSDNCPGKDLLTQVVTALQIPNKNFRQGVRIRYKMQNKDLNQELSSKLALFCTWMFWEFQSHI